MEDDDQWYDVWCGSSCSINGLHEALLVSFDKKNCQWRRGNAPPILYRAGIQMRDLDALSVRVNRADYSVA